MQFCSAILMSIHRISAILFISSYDKFWRRWYLLVTTVFIVYSIIPQFAGLPTSVELVNDTLILTSDSEITTAIGIRYAIFSVTYFILLIVIGITVARVALKKLQEIQGTNVDLNVSRKLTKIALTYGLLYSGVLGYSIASFINAVFLKVPDFIVKIQSVLLTTASDMITLSLPYVLLVFDSNIKRDIRRAIALPSTVVVVPSSSADTNGPV
uniref:Serpentine receptor class gamma n=1 Tax=Caenorhabditis tropicalis TaxID=1561998 RepID=A0A1I7UBF5_9PELO